MEQTYYLISDAAKRVQVESHVLRYWEEELGLPIKRNELGHRFYTEEDIERFITVRELKEKGLQLKAIKLVMQDDESFEEEMEKKNISVVSKSSPETESKNDKAVRMQLLLRQMIVEAIKDSNEELCENLRDSIVKEMDYQFRTLEEREEERALTREKKEEEHYQKIDELLRNRFKPKKEKKTEKRTLFYRV